MNTEMRRKDRQLSQQDAQQILQNGEWGVLSVVCPDGTPYGRPVNYAYEAGTLYFHGTAADGLFRQCLSPEGCPACFTVVGRTQVLPGKFSTKYESVIAFGTLRESQDKSAILRRLAEKYSPEFLDQADSFAAKLADRTAVYEMSITSLTGKARRQG